MSEENACACGAAVKWVWIVLALAIAGVLIAKYAGHRSGELPVTEGACCGGSSAVVVGPGPVAEGPPAVTPPAVGPERALPRLVDLGAGKCIPCKMMAPILEDLKKTCAGRLDVQFIDVRESPDASKQYGIRVIPTQIFYGADGKEVFRHEGFFGKEDILAKWKEFGVDLAAAASK